MKLSRRSLAAVATAFGAVALTALPASAYTSDAFGLRCVTNTGSYAVFIEGDWHRANDGSSATLANAFIWADSIYSWDVTSSRWEDLTTGTVMRGVTGFVPADHTLPASGSGWNPNTWYRAGHNRRWTVSGYRDTDHNVTFICYVRP